MLTGENAISEVTLTSNAAVLPPARCALVALVAFRLLADLERMRLRIAW